MRCLFSYKIRGKVAIIKPVVCIECGIAVIPIDATVILVGTALSNKLNLHCTLRGALGTRSRSGNSHLSNGIRSRSDVSEETITRFEEVVLNVDSVEGDIESTLWQTVDG